MLANTNTKTWQSLRDGRVALAQAASHAESRFGNLLDSLRDIDSPVVPASQMPSEMTVCQELQTVDVRFQELWERAERLQVSCQLSSCADLTN
jgi:hypothetical protein